MKRVAIVAAALALSGCAIQFVPELQADGTLDYGIGSAANPLFDQILVAGAACPSLEQVRGGAKAPDCVQLSQGTHVAVRGRTLDAAFFHIRVGRWPVLKDYWVPAGILLTKPMQA